MTHRILHLSDTHLTASTGPDAEGVDATAALEGLLHDVRHVRDLDLVVLTGDVADDGSTAGCRKARDLVGAFADARAIPHVYVVGNHDDRGSFTEVLRSGHLHGDADVAGSTCGGPERAALSTVRGLRVVTLDTLVPGEVAGHVTRAQLDWLTSVLSTPAAAGTVLALHHPPICTPSLDVTAEVGLRNADELAAVLDGTDVQAVLCGHYHLQLSGRLGDVPVWVTPGVATRIDLTAPPHLERIVLGAGATVVDLGGPYGPMFSVLQARSPDAGTQVALVDSATGDDVDDEPARSSERI